MKFVRGNIWDDPAPNLVITVNCVGVMGKGIALEAKRRWPKLYHDYRKVCFDELEIFDPCDLRFMGRYGNSPNLYLAATKGHWKYPSKLEWIESCLNWTGHNFYGEEEAIAIPALGCGNGGFEWSLVKVLCEFHLQGTNARVYEPE